MGDNAVYLANPSRGLAGGKEGPLGVLGRNVLTGEYRASKTYDPVGLEVVENCRCTI
jgi:hypothetical protein